MGNQDFLLEETPAPELWEHPTWSLLELVNAYGTVINDGMEQDPVLVTRIEDRNGHVLYKHMPQTVQGVPVRKQRFLMTEMLKAGLSPNRWGTSQALWAFDLFNSNTEFGGKTGTSSNHSRCLVCWRHS